VQVDVVGGGGEAVAAVHGGDGVGAVALCGAAHEGLEGAGGVGGRVVGVPDLVHEEAGGDGPAGAEGEDGEECAQARAADRHRGAVGLEGLGGAEDAVAHGVHCLRWGGEAPRPARGLCTVGQSRVFFSFGGFHGHHRRSAQ
jgi:hypothetical protein